MCYICSDKMASVIADGPYQSAIVGWNVLFQPLFLQVSQQESSLIVSPSQWHWHRARQPKIRPKRLSETVPCPCMR